MPEAIHVFRVYSVVAILYLQSTVQIMLFFVFIIIIIIIIIYVGETL